MYRGAHRNFGADTVNMLFQFTLKRFHGRRCLPGHYDFCGRVCDHLDDGQNRQNESGRRLYCNAVLGLVMGAIAELLGD